MKYFKLIYSPFVLFTLLLPVNTQDSQIIFLLDATLNRTAAFGDLKSIEGNYLYFSYDFSFHSNAVKENKDIAYFHLNTDYDFICDEPIGYGFIKNNWTDIINSSEIEDINWEKTFHKYKKMKNIYTNYYYEIKRTNNKTNTLLLRIPTNKYKNGFFTIKNVLEIPNQNINSKRNLNNERNIMIIILFLLLLSLFIIKM